MRCNPTLGDAKSAAAESFSVTTPVACVCLLLAAATCQADKFYYRDADGQPVELEATLVGSEQDVYVLETSDGRYHLVPRARRKAGRVRRAGRLGRPGDGGSIGTGVHRRAVPELPARSVCHRRGPGLALAQSIRRRCQSILARRGRVHEERRGRVCALCPRRPSGNASGHPSRGRADLRDARGFCEVRRRRDVGRRGHGQTCGGVLLKANEHPGHSPGRVPHVRHAPARGDPPAGLRAENPAANGTDPNVVRRGTGYRL